MTIGASSAPDSRAARFGKLIVQIEGHESRAVTLAFLCYFVLFGSYYILRPVRDTVATVFGADQLQTLFTGTFIVTFIASPIFGALAARVRLSRLLPGIFWFWLLNVLLFAVLFDRDPQSRWIGGAYYIWFSVSNLFMISVFWSLMVDLFSSAQATRLFPLIAAGGSLGAIAGPLVTRVFVARVGLAGLLIISAAGFLLVIVLVHMLMREKERLRTAGEEVQPSTLDHDLGGNPFEGFTRLLRSAYLLNQAAFMLLMTWIATIAYFLQTDLIANAFSDVTDRARAIADMDLAVNIISAVILIFGLGHVMKRFGVTAGLVLSPILMAISFIGLALSPTVFAIQAAQVMRRVTQYALARPSREISFTVVDQETRYKAKNVVDTVMYRFGDLSSAWVQTGMRAAGFGIAGVMAVGVEACGLWAAVSMALGRRYEVLRCRGGRND
jgi:AAA family ATP:ADP antiporter